MSRDPVLGTFRARAREYRGNSVTVKGGLHYLRGNPKPYFSLTCDIYDARGKDIGGGANHELILSGLPHLKPLADLHLSDIDGVPMHAEANGWYWLLGACPALQGGRNQYHGGNSKGHHGGEYRLPTPDECLAIFANYMRIDLATANEVRDTVMKAYNGTPQYKRIYEDQGSVNARAAFAPWAAAQAPRWKQEAEDCIKALGLVVYGDTWQADAPTFDTSAIGA